MNKKIKNFIIATALIVSFILWTLLISFVDVQQIGPNGSSVGFATINSAIHKLFGVNFSLYNITDWAGLVPVVFGLGFALLGLIQWIKRKHILKVDISILILGVFYIVTLILYLTFESIVINYRPVLINGYLEASYPSSTTLLVLCVMPTAIMQLKDQIKNKVLNLIMISLISLFIIFMVIGRLISGVHWVTDIIGGILLSSGLVMIYYSFVSFLKNNIYTKFAPK